MQAKSALQRLTAAIGFSRWKGLLPIAAAAILSLIAIDLSLLWLTGANPRRFVLPQAYLDWDHFERAADVTAGLVAALHPLPDGKTQPFLLYAGLSSALQGIDLNALAAQDGCNLRVSGICGTGGSMSELLAIEMGVLQSNLRPAIAVLCVHPAWLAGQFPAPPPASVNPIGPLRRADWREALERVEWWNWIGKNRFYTNQLAFKILYAARLELGTAAQVDPWRDPERIAYPAHKTKDAIQYQKSYLAAHGWFDQRRYQREQSRQAADLGKLISAFRDRGTEVLVAIMPETKAFRELVPAEPRQYLLAYLRGRVGNSVSELFDFQDAIADDMFCDLVHLNDEGRAQFTSQLARAIRTRSSSDVSFKPRLN